MLILGINDSHDASACLIKNGQLLAVMPEERIVRSKNVASLPIHAIKQICKSSKIKFSDIDCVALATKKSHHLNFWNVNQDFSSKDWLKFNEDYYYKLIYKKKKLKIRSLFPKYKPSVKMGYQLSKIPFKTSDECTSNDHKNLLNLRINTISEYLGINKKKILLFDHHECHALYGYYSNNIDLNSKKTVIVTSDAGGDGTYETVSTIEKGKYRLVSKGRGNLIGVIYATITILLGMNPVRHPYKVMGLAPYASELQKKISRNIFLNSLKVKKLNFKKDKKMKDYFVYFKDKLIGQRFDGIAGGLQDFVEIRLVEWFKEIYKKTKSNHYIFSGGVANNVKANKVLIDQSFVKSLYVPPGPGDESISIGACYAALAKKFGYSNLRKYIKPIKNAYLCSKIEKGDLKKFDNNKFVKKNFKKIRDENLKKTAKVLSRGNIVFFCQGNMEFGQRALGHRSILSDPSKLEQVKKLNDTIKRRDFWMPFTPSILDEDYNKYVNNPKNIQSDFMTICFESKAIAKKHFCAAIHPYDFTIRPQRVSKQNCLKYYKLIKEFKKLTGIGGLLNTSLNVHDKPIINQPTDIIKEILTGKKKIKNINYIFIEDFLYERKIKN